MADARKIRLESNVAWGLLKGAKKITTAKGNKIRTWNPGKDKKAEILKHVIGPSGNLRAPTYRVKDEFIIGFNPELYNEWLGGK